MFKHGKELFKGSHLINLCTEIYFENILLKCIVFSLTCNGVYVI